MTTTHISVVEWFNTGSIRFLLRVKSQGFELRQPRALAVGARSGGEGMKDLGESLLEYTI